MLACRLSGVVLVLVGLAGQAAAGKARLVYERGPRADSCPDEAGMRAEVVGLIGHDPFGAGSTVVECRIVAVDSGLHARILVLDRDGGGIGERRLAAAELDPAPGCEALAKAVALTLAMAADNLPEQPESQPATMAAVVTPAPRPVNPSQPTWVPPTWVLGVGGRVDLSAGPLGPGGLLGVARRHGAASFGLEATVTLPGSFAQGEGHVTIGEVGLALVPCLHRRALAACAHVGGGLVVSSPSGYPEERQTAASEVKAGARLAWTAHLAGPLALEARAGVDLMLLGATVQVATPSGTARLWETPAIAADLGLVAIVALP